MSRSSDPFSYHPRLEKLKDYVRDHIDEAITLADAAGVVSLEPKYFSAFFKKRTGKPFSVWLHDMRISRAAEILSTTDLPIRIVYLEVGYTNHSTFLRTFKERTGLTPGRFKQEARPIE